MKIIVTHNSPDWDAITSVWLLKKYFSGWEDAVVNFVPAGTRLGGEVEKGPIEISGNNEIIHVDTGLGPLDHHQTSDMNTCAASLTFDYVKNQNQELLNVNNDKIKAKLAAIQKIVDYVVALDHFQEIFWPNAADYYHEFGFFGILEGYKSQYQNQDLKYVEFGIILLDAILHRMEEVIWAEEEIKAKGKEFNTRFGKGLAIETINDDVIKLAQKKGFAIVVRKDPRKGYVRIKVRPKQNPKLQTMVPMGNSNFKDNIADIDLTLIKEQLAKMDPDATWFLHVSKKMLLNGTPKNPKMIPTTLSLSQIVKVVERI